MSWDNVTQGLPDEAFIRGTIPMTKCEVRTISLAKLQLKKNSTVLDIGCGTGSISVECGLLCPEGHITAIDQNEEAIALTQENAAHFKVKNISVIHGKAPEELPKQSFDRIFLGGGSRVIDPIITYVKAYLKPEGLFVANTILLESTFKLLTALENEGFKEITCINIQVSRGVQELGWMMKALNPIYMITAVNPKREDKTYG